MGTSSCLSAVSLLQAFIRRSVTAAGLTSQAAEVDGGTTNIHFWGPPAATSKPKLLLIHGFGPLSIWQWRHQATLFAGEFDVYIPDLVFFGESSTASASRSEIFQASCLAKLMESLGASRYSVVGTSYGGYVAYRMAEMCRSMQEMSVDEVMEEIHAAVVEGEDAARMKKMKTQQ